MKKKIIMAIALLLIVFGAYQGTLAIFHQETNVNSPITAGKLGIEIINPTTKKTSEPASFEKILPGAIVDHEVSILNAKDKDLYVRVTLTRYWADENGKKVSDADASYILPITKNPSDWMMMEDDHSNNEILYFYYKKPMTASDVTSNVIDQIEFDSDISEQRYTTYQAHVEINAEAVQTIGAQDAMLSQWGMEVELDGNGNIVTITE